jgi:hypothetical protein
MITWLRRSAWIALLSLLAVTPALAQRIGGHDPFLSAPCPGVPLNCIQSSPIPPLAVNGVQRVYVVWYYDTGPSAGTYAQGCGTAWYVNHPTPIGPGPFATFVTARHVLEGNDAGGHYSAVSVQLEFFYVPLANRICGNVNANECHIFPSDCSQPVIRQAPCWDWDDQCDLGRIFLAPPDVPASANPLALGFDPAVGMTCWIPQHPQGRCMEWAQALVVQTPPGCTFLHQISTQGGSSGAPVLYQDLVVGVHVAASVDAANNPTCPNLAVYESSLAAFLAKPPVVNCNPTGIEKKSWGNLKTIYR